MKKELSSNPMALTGGEMRREYDFAGGVRGKHFNARLHGHTIEIHKRDGTTLTKHVRPKDAITLEPDVQAYFPTSKAVNHALRTLISLVPEKPEVGTGKRRNSRSGHRLVAKGHAKSIRLKRQSLNRKGLPHG